MSVKKAQVAIVGGGPSGFYLAQALLAEDAIARVDMFEKLPTPYGLVRYGVAPDHENTKRITALFDRIAQHQNFSFFGNVEIGKDIAVDELRTFYDAVVFATGASEDATLSIIGDAADDLIPANAFSAWYNSHPDHHDARFDLGFETAAIIGNGNVTLDLCRVLAKSSAELSKTDISQSALEALSLSQRSRVFIIGRRGPEHAKFSNPELNELRNLAGWRLWVNPRDIPAEGDETFSSNQTANLDFFRKVGSGPEPAPNERAVIFVFHRQPVSATRDGGLILLGLERTDPRKEKGAASVAETLSVGAVFKSIGNRSIRIPGLPFDQDTRRVPNKNGRIINPKGGEVVPGLYVVGWAKRGPSGTIGTNRTCAIETATCILDDLRITTRQLAGPEAKIEQRLGEMETVSYTDWEKLREIEISSGTALGRPRSKFESKAAMFDALRSQQK